MSSSNSQDSTDGLENVLGYLRKKGVRIWSENDQLHYKAPKGALTQEEIAKLSKCKGEIIDFLKRVTGSDIVEPRLESPLRADRVPLTFSQLSHWHWYQLGHQPHLRQIASAMRLRGRLNLSALQRSIAEIFNRHEALRTRVIVFDGTPMQEILESVDWSLEIDDLTAYSESLQEAEVKRLVEEYVRQPVDVTVDPLFGIRLLKLSDREHVLIVAMEHMISDAFSMNILLQDLLTGYKQVCKDCALSLPPIPIEFADYAIRQRNEHESWIEKHGVYWNERLTGCGRVRFPVDESLPTETQRGWGAIPVRIERALKAELREWCRLKGTTRPMAAFTAYVGLVARWCNVSDFTIQFVTDGRVSQRLQSTIGFFASSLSLRMALSEDDSLIDLMNQVTEEYCRAYEHADFSYIEAQIPRPEFVRNTAFNWVPQGSETELSDLNGSDDAIACSPVYFEHPMLENLERDAEPVILLYDADDEIAGNVSFPRDRFSVDTMQRFESNYLLFLRALLRKPKERVKDVVLL